MRCLNCTEAAHRGSLLFPWLDYDLPESVKETSLPASVLPLRLLSDNRSVHNI